MATVFAENLAARIRTQLGGFTVSPGAGHRTPSSKGSSEGKKEESNGTSPTRIGRPKLAREGEIDDISDKDEDEDKREEKAFKQPSQESSQKHKELKFACHYHKRYQLPCSGPPGWPNIQRLKAHLYRSHRISHSCDRCCQSFTSADDLHAHMVAREPCRFRTRDHCEGFTQATKERLEPVGRHQGSTGETDQASQWWEIYGILFPDVPRENYPSPYYEEDDDYQTADAGTLPIVSSSHECAHILQLASDDSDNEHDINQTYQDVHGNEERQNDAEEMSDPQRATVDRVMRFFSNWFNREIGVTTSNEGPGPANTEGSCINQSAQQTGTGVGNSGSGGIGRRNARRPAKRGWDDDGDKDEHDAQDKRPKVEGPLAKKLACPFYKHSPRRYKRQRSEKRSSCCGPGWDSMHRLKEHLYRRHGLKNVCIRCFERFNDQDELDAHTRAAIWCEPHNGVLLDTITPSQEKKLKSRKKDSEAVSESQKWVKTYREILFPDLPHDETPSPFYEDEDVVKEKEDQMEDYKAYLRRDLPPLVRNWLEQEVQRRLDPNEDELKLRVIQIARELQLALLDSYLKSEGPKASRAAPASPETAPSLAPVPGLPEPVPNSVAAAYQEDLVVNGSHGLLDTTGSANLATTRSECGTCPEEDGDLSALDVGDFEFDLFGGGNLPDPLLNLDPGYVYMFGELESARTNVSEPWSSDLPQISG
ncbi:hypothetical protein MGG_04644 [Pyricularia oryzae 70-15]|uniref:C2H2-type domain-containing protein n=3 Tax=Pyricularia oryzae TaxID=318829 RepID=G4MSX4_PYRO7|nr:uncharacterized protein MGG_04644 [Pyricularia oryzae 70-15]EHA53828.1 hypothetical protein MGG_04644 [Pyricularia oryzae 70-15]ELQ37100.1 hypothetical protein OOU_Y34scaffold00619g74 [Pyricularia oryzae Y34]KAI7920893.1 hypothetical protein M0657_006356 [Pyricularia oryzae]KAI7931212.1 hypothetical protein M9X92_000498 [Pyricularia oryzae]